MGNHQSNLSVGKYFENEIVSTDDVDINNPIVIIVHLNPPAINNENKEINRLVIVIPEEDSFFLSPEEIIHDESIAGSREGKLCETNINYHFYPKSHMRDFEVAKNDNSLKIARGQGVGVLIIEQMCQYFKIFYDNTQKYGVNFWFAMWNHSNEAQNILKNDLNLGWDVMLCTIDDTFRLCEENDERDEMETLIMFPHLEKYANYNVNSSTDVLI